jgi:hypothetical protein
MRPRDSGKGGSQLWEAGEGGMGSYQTFIYIADFTSRKRAFGLDPLVPASIWAGTKGPATSPQIRQPPGRL